MAERRGGESESESEGGLGRTNCPASIIGLPEVDKIMDGAKFRKLPVFSLACKKSTAVQRFTHTRGSLAWCKISNDNVDHISRMPDDILQFIISLLTMREAVTTTILSTRWRNLWTSSFSCLEFDIPNMLGYEYPNVMFENKSQEFLMEKRSNFTTWVDQVMQRCLGSKLDALRVSFILNQDSASYIDKWIMSAVTQGATDIFLDFHYERFHGRLHDPCQLYEFPTQEEFVSKLKYLHLKSCKLHLTPSFTGFTSLISLYLTAIRIPQSLMENILSKCPLLEFLSINYCAYPKFTSFRFVGPSLQLKHLRIGINYDITNIELHGLNLLSFELGMSKANVSIKDTPYLAKLVLLTALKPVEILSETPRLETLFLYQTFEETSIVSQSHVFKTLKRLVFIPFCITNLLGVVHILAACPLLEKLELDMGSSKESITRDSNSRIMEKLAALPRIPLENLKEIEINGFQAHPEKFEFVTYLLKNATMLQKMDIYTMRNVYCGNGTWRPCKDTSRMQAISDEEVHRLHQIKAHSSAKVRLFNSFPSVETVSP